MEEAMQAGDLTVPAFIVSGAFGVGTFFIRYWMSRMQQDIATLVADVRSNMARQADHDTRIVVLEKSHAELKAEQASMRERYHLIANDVQALLIKKRGGR
jgi:hypothetical protein